MAVAALPTGDTVIDLAPLHGARTHLSQPDADGYSVVTNPATEAAETARRREFLAAFDADAFTAEIDELTDDPDLRREL